MVYRLSLRACRLLLPVMLALPLTGCVRGLFEGDKTILSPEIIKVTVPTESVKPTVKEAPASPSGAKPSPAPAATQPTPPQVEEKLLPRELSPRSPEGIMPVPAPAPAPPAPRSQTPSPALPLPAPRAHLANPPDAVHRDAFLTEDVVWQGEVLVEGGVTVAPQATLTVAPGTIVRFQENGAGVRGVLLVQGRIQVKGTLARPVIFTSNFAEPLAGDWQGVVLLASEKQNLIEHLRLRGAETGLDAAFSTITISNSRFSQCRTGARFQDTLVTVIGGGMNGCGVGLSLHDSETDIRDLAVTGNGRGGTVVRSSLALSGGTFEGNVREALLVDSSRVRITAAGFTGNGSGLKLVASEGAVTASRFGSNADFGLLLTGSRVRVSDNEIAGNRTCGLRVEDGLGIAWGNRFAANGRYDLYNAGVDDFRAIGNWWEAPAVAVAGRIYDRGSDASRGIVYYQPVLQTRPHSQP